MANIEGKRHDGALLIRDLGLAKFNYIWVQKVMNLAIPMFIITVDSRYPFTYLSMQKVKKAQGTLVKKAKRQGFSIDIRDFKLTPPLELETAHVQLSSDSIIIVRDLAGDYWRNDKMYEETNPDFKNKIVKLEE